MSYFSPSETCGVCGQPPHARRAYLCDRCHRLSNQGGHRKIGAEIRFQAMKEQWSQEAKAFRCHFTKVMLSDDPFSPKYATWEHLEPGNPKTAVLACALINHMKTDLNESDFRNVVRELARFFADPDTDFNQDVFPNRPWRPKASVRTAISTTPQAPFAEQP